MSIIHIFDIDGTLTPPKKPMDPAFAKAFKEWAKYKTFCLVTGGTFEDVSSQIPYDILSLSQIIFTCSGNATYGFVSNSFDEPKNPILTSYNEFEETQELLDFLNFELKYSNWGAKFGNHIERRQGAINFSVIGRNANDEWRQKYYEFDKHDGERRRIATAINERFPLYWADIGGMISIDITMRGKDKRQILDWLKYLDLANSSVKFYGDKVSYGNDKPLADEIEKRKCGTSYEVTGYNDLIELLELKYPVDSQDL